MTTPPLSLRPLALLVSALALAACGADVDSYEPSIGGILNEGVDPNAPPQDVSFVDGDDVTRVSDTTCGGPYSMLVVGVLVANEYRQRSVQLRYVDGSCTERDGALIPPGQQPEVFVQTGEVIRVYDAADSTLLSSWLVRLNELSTDRIVLRSTSPDI